MRIQPKKSNKKLLILSIVCALVVGGVSAYLLSAYVNRGTQSSDVPKIVESKNDKNNPDSNNEGVHPEPQNTQTKVEDKTPIQYEGEQINDEPVVDDERFRLPEEGR